MTNLKIGTAGIPFGTEDRNTQNGIRHLRKIGLDAMELEFVRSVNLTEEKAKEVDKVRRHENIALTCHGSYFINLNAKEDKKKAASRQRILQAANIANQAGAWSLTFHAGFYLKMDADIVYNNIKEELKKIIAELKDSGNEIWISPETTGKATQWGHYKEIIKLSQELEQVQPCIDFAHLHARTNGKYNTKEEFETVLSEVEEKLGQDYLKRMHIHLSGIDYGEKGEKKHLPLEESDLNYKDLFKTLKKFKVKGNLTCESPNLEKDALIMKKYYTSL